MAINYEDIVSKLENDPLTSEELLLIQEAEEHIDSVIKEKFGIQYYETHIDKCIVRFDYSVKNKKHIDIKQPRRNVMQRELIKRYSDAGWKVEFNTDVDNPYVTFKGKK